MNWPCPVTGWAITRMGRASFDRACKARRDKNNNTCGRCNGHPPELEVIEMASSKSKETVADVVGPLKAKAELLDRVAEIMGCEADGLIEAMELMQGHVQAIRNLVEPEVVDDHPASLPEACRALVNRYHWARDAAMTVREKLDGAEARIAELEAELATCRAETPAADRGAECLDVGASVYRDALADFGASVLAGRVLVTFRDAP